MIPGTSCLATIVLSLRDKSHSPFDRSNSNLVNSQRADEQFRNTILRGDNFRRPLLYICNSILLRKTQSRNSRRAAIGPSDLHPWAKSPQLQVEAALRAFLSVIRDTEEEKIRTPEYQTRVATLLNELNQADVLFAESEPVPHNGARSGRNNL